MSPRSIEEIVADYHTCLQQACLTGKINQMKLHFADDIAIVGPHHKLDGRVQVISKLEESLSHIEKISIVHQFFDRSSACTIADYVTKKPHERIPHVSWHKVKNGMIYEIHNFYDTEDWKKAIGLRKAG